MIQVRSKVFETNSSMTHSLVICENNEYTNWLESYSKELPEGKTRNDYYLFSPSYGKFLPYEEAIKKNVEHLFDDLENECLNDDVTTEDIEEYAKGNKSLYELTEDFYELYLTNEEFDDHYYYYEVEPFKYTLKSGDVLEGFCYFGHD